MRARIGQENIIVKTAVQSERCKVPTDCPLSLVVCPWSLVICRAMAVPGSKCRGILPVPRSRFPNPDSRPLAAVGHFGSPLAPRPARLWRALRPSAPPCLRACVPPCLCASVPPWCSYSSEFCILHSALPSTARGGQVRRLNGHPLRPPGSGRLRRRCSAFCFPLRTPHSALRTRNSCSRLALRPHVSPGACPPGLSGGFPVPRPARQV
jgi:hypothetical protein